MLFPIMSNLLRQYGRVPNERDEAIRMLKQLLDEYERTDPGAKDDSDEEHLSKFDDLWPTWMSCNI